MIDLVHQNFLWLYNISETCIFPPEIRVTKFYKTYIPTNFNDNVNLSAAYFNSNQSYLLFWKKTTCVSFF